jgi:hypothetical protein
LHTPSSSSRFCRQAGMPNRRVFLVPQLQDDQSSTVPHCDD